MGQSVIINIITELNYRCNCTLVFLKYKYNVNTCIQKVHCIKLLI